jgi:hypothetical protein
LDEFLSRRFAGALMNVGIGRPGCLKPKGTNLMREIEQQRNNRLAVRIAS